MRTNIGRSWFDCSCGHIEMAGTGTPEEEIGRSAARHVGTNHPRERNAATNVGCLNCDCKAIFEPIISAFVVCDCGHTVARHDQFCCVMRCDNILPHAFTPRIDFATNSIYYFCSEHLAQLGAK